MSDTLGKRIKEKYEYVTRYRVPARSFVIIRIDGNAFHSLTKVCDKPFDKKLMRAIDSTAIKLCNHMQNVKIAYTQSDEINLLLCDFDTIRTQQWFDGVIQKMCSISASIATAHFNSLGIFSSLAHFDSRVFTIPDPVEVANYFIWRQNDATKNSIQMAARALYSHSELVGKKLEQLQEMIYLKGGNWNNFSVREKRGGCCIYDEDAGFITIDPPVFTKDRRFLENIIENIRKD